VLRERLTADDWRGWQRYYAASPFGDVRDDLRAAIVAHWACRPHLKRAPKIGELMYESAAGRRARMLKVQADDEIAAQMAALMGRVNKNHGHDDR